MRSTPAKIASHVAVFVVVIVVMSALSIWLGTGPVVCHPDRLERHRESGSNSLESLVPTASEGGLPVDGSSQPTVVLRFRPSASPADLVAGRVRWSGAAARGSAD